MNFFRGNRGATSSATRLSLSEEGNSITFIQLLSLCGYTKISYTNKKNYNGKRTREDTKGGQRQIV
jgi:hypothetical protein